MLASNAAVAPHEGTFPDSIELHNPGAKAVDLIGFSRGGAEIASVVRELGSVRRVVLLAPAFDFEGSMIESVERFFRAFGGQQRPYFHVTKTSSRLMKMRRDVRSWLTT